jgi:hypothetical protein
MGIIKKIIFSKKIEDNNINDDRFCIELCENVHFHYKDIRLEFDPKEFLHILKSIKKIKEKDILDFQYNNENFKEIVKIKLDGQSVFENRYQMEEQINGFYHTHYRNLRIENKKIIKLL